MKPFAKFATLIIILIFLAQTSVAQFLASSYYPKNKTEKLILSKIRSLPEIKEWFKTARDSKPDLMINEPDSTSKYYSIQVGLSNMNIFRTNYWLLIDPKTLKIYYRDLFVESGDGIITLQQWRYWRTKPGFQKAHFYKAGKLIISKG